MKNFLRSFLVKASLVSVLIISFVVPNVASAAATIGSVTLNGSATVSVAPSASISVIIPVSITGSDDWESTSYRIGSSGSYTCVNTTDHTNSGSFTENLNITAPASNGTYNLEVRTHGSNFGSNNTCSTSFGTNTSSKTVANAITIATVPSTGTLVVKKNVIGDGVASSFQFQVDGGVLTSYEADGQNDITVTPGNHSITEPSISGYTNTYSNSLNANPNCTSLNVPASGTITCTITSTKIPNSITNPSFEQGAVDTATGWTKSDFANIPAVFSIVPGRQSDRAAEVSIATPPPASTDAKWISPSVSVTPGQYYTLSFWYKSSTTTEADIIYNGSNFVWLTVLAPTADWTRYDTSFIVPAGMTTFGAAAILASEGSLTVDDFQLVLGTAPIFDRGRVSLTFDDGWKNIYLNGAPIMNAAGIKSTQYIYTDPVVGNPSNYAVGTYMTLTDLLALQSEGHDIAAHTRKHLDLVNDDPVAFGYADRDALWQGEVNGSKSDLLGAGLTPVDNLAYPYGSYNDDVKTKIQSAGFIGARSVDQGYNFTNSDKYSLKIQHVTNLTTSTEIKGWIDQSVADKTWLILMFHEINDGANPCLGDDPTECADKQILQDAVDYLKTNNVCVLTMSQALNNAPCNQAPVLDVIADQQVVVNNTLTFTAHATDPNTADVLSYSISGGPVGSVIDSVTGIFSWTTNLASASTTVTVSVSDGQGGTDSQVVNIEVLPDTVAPTVAISTSASAKTNLASIPVSVAFSENVSGFDQANDVAISNGTFDNLQSSDAAHYTFNVLPVADGEVTVKILSGVASDLSSNLNLESNTLSVISDRTKPLIVLNGLGTVATTTQSEPYFDEGATASDIIDGNISANIQTVSTVNMNLPGAYTINYNVSDSAHNAADTVIRTVLVSDQSGPVISVPSNMTVEADSVNGKVVSYTLPTANDAVDGDVSASVVCLLTTDSTFPIGENIISCTAHDNAETPNTSAASFKIIVVDSIAPTVTAPADQTFEAIGPLTTPILEMATTSDLVDPNPVLAYSPHSFSVGTTTVVWTSTDASGNEGSATSKVIITDTGVPTIHLNGNALIILALNGSYTDLGATATDVVDGTVPVTVDSSEVNPAVEGEYFVKYNATDTEGNVAVEVKRKIVVSSLELSGEIPQSISHSSAIINWTTTHPGTSRVVWDTVSHATITNYNAPNYGYANSTDEDTTLVTDHSVQVTGLSPVTTYYFRAISHGSPEVVGAEMSMKTAVTPQPSGPTPSSTSSSGGGGGGGGGGSSHRATQVATTSVAIAPVGQVLGATTSGGGFYFTKTLMIGSIGSEVAELQKRLTSEGVYNGPITGNFGVLTDAGVKAYQTKYGIDPIGTVGPKTRAQLNGVNGGIVLGASTSATAGMTLDQMKDLLKKLQAQLAELLAKQKTISQASAPAYVKS